MVSLNAILAILQQSKVDLNTDLSKQIILKVNILGTYFNSIQTTSITINKSQRLIDVRIIK